MQIKLMEYQIQRYLKIHVNEFVSLKDVCYYANTTPSVTGRIVKGLDMDITVQKSTYKEISYRYNVESPKPPDYYEQLIHRFQEEANCTSRTAYVGRKCLELAYPHTLLQMQPDSIILMCMKSGLMDITTENSRKFYLSSCKSFLKWLSTKEKQYSHWFTPETCKKSAESKYEIEEECFVPLVRAKRRTGVSA